MNIRAAAPRVLVTDDEETLRFILREILTREGFIVEEACDGEEAVEKATAAPFDLYLLDMKMPRRDGLSALRSIRALYPDALALMVTAFGTQQVAVDALKAGAYDYFTKPFNLEELIVVVRRALEKQSLLRQLNDLREQVGAADPRFRMIGASAAARRLFQQIDQAASHDVTALIEGESGCGKELAAEAIHGNSPRAAGPLVKVNCAAIPETLIESELFGHERGAFTGAAAARPGKFEQANGGTVFLDEIGELPLMMQSKLLRVLQEREVDRVGGAKPRPVDIRVLAATNRDLGAMVREGRFREDLYYRLNVFPVRLPPLRERMEDLPALVQHFVALFNVRFGKRVEGLAPEAMARLEAHRWPGNIRELENAIQRAMVLTSGPVIGLDAFADLGAIARPGAPPAVPLSADDFSRPLADRVEAIVEEVERQTIRAALEKMCNRRQETADLLGMSRKSLHNKMAKYGMFAGSED